MTENLIIPISRLNPSPQSLSEVEKMLDKEDNWGNVIDKALNEKVTALLYKNLKGFSEKIPDSIFMALKKTYYQNAAHSLSVIHELKPLFKEITAAGIKAVVVKGVRLSATLYRDLGLRPYMDVDFIVYPPQRKQLVSVLERLRFAKDEKLLLDKKMKEKEELFWTYRPHFKKGKALIEIHNSFPGLHLPFTLEKDLWAGVQKIEIDGVDAEVLSLEYELCLLCIHVQQHSYCRLLWLTDIVEMAVLKELDWEKVFYICRHEKIHALVYYSLYLVNQLWPGSIPDDVLLRFQVNAIEKKMLDFFWPKEKVISRSISEDMPMHTPTLFVVLSKRKFLLSIKTIFEFFFPPRVWVAYYYNIPLRSIRIFYHYLWRLFRPLTLIFRRSFRI